MTKMELLEYRIGILENALSSFLSYEIAMTNNHHREKTLSNIHEGALGEIKNLPEPDDDS